VRGRDPIVPGLHETTFRKRIVRVLSYRYLLSVPDPAVAGPGPWPLLLFLHGSGERGSDLALVKRHGPPRLLDEGAALPCIVVAPQCPRGEWWSTETLEALLDHVLATCPADPGRVWLTGISMGGYGAWALATRIPKRIAALVPICGGGNPRRADRLKGVPISAFHGARDDVVAPSETLEMVEAVNRAGGDARLTLYPDAGHDAWTRAYADPALWAWLAGCHL
jgi:predicted peptidase